MRTLVFAAATLFATSAFAQDADPTPNIVFLMADNLGYGDLGAYGGGEIRGMPTPEIDALAAEGLMLTQFLVEPGCTPTRAATMTARYSIRSGLSLALVRGTPNTLQDDEYTMGEMLKDVGYATAYIGKWHLGSEPKSMPQNQGFDSFYGILNSTDESQFASRMRLAGYEPSEADKAYIWQGDAGTDGETVKEYTLDVRRTIDFDLTDRAIAYIEEQAQTEDPFFLFLSFTRPHSPSLMGPDFDGVSISGMYGDAVMELDHNTGRVLDAIDAAGIAGDTIVVWMSDNGPWKTMNWPDGGSAGPFRGELGSAWEGSIRTAGMIRWPGRIAPGASNEMFSTMDFMPSFAALVGGEMPSDRPIDGVDQSAFLLGEQETSNREGLITFIGDDLVAVRWKHFRIYLQDVIQAGNGFVGMGGTQANRIPHNGYPRIYNIAADPREEYDVGATDSWVAGQYMRVIGRYLATLAEHPNPPASNLTDY